MCGVDRRGRVAVVGGYGTALTFNVGRTPAAGETVLAQALEVGPGGKGSNQAIAAARLGCQVSMLTSVGDDSFADAAFALWAEEGVDASAVRRVRQATMTGVIMVEPSGENRIVVAPGALSSLCPDDVEAFAGAIGAACVCAVSLEIPAEAAARALALARRSGTLALLNPAPALTLPDEVLGAVDVLVPNASEATSLTGSSEGTSPEVLVDRLRARCRGAVVLTLGAAGVLVDEGTARYRVPAPPPPRVVDTTGAGDAFTGALAAALAHGLAFGDAVDLAVEAASASVGTAGVVPSLARRSELPALHRRRLSGGRP